jgi:hypothetical protein
VRGYVAQQHHVAPETWKLEHHKYDGRRKDSPLRSDLAPDEVFLVGEVMAETQALAGALADTARVATVVSCPDF